MTRTIRGVWGCVALSVSLAGCGEDDPERLDAVRECSSACAEAQFDCNLDAADTRLCERRCVTQFSTYPDACIWEGNKALECIVRTREWHCYGPEPMLCDDELSNYKRCLVQNMPAPKAAYCTKCKSCYSKDESFSASFCSPFWDGDSFVVTSCATDGDIMRIGDKTLSEGAIDSMDCSAFAEHM